MTALSLWVLVSVLYLEILVCSVSLTDRNNGFIFFNDISLKSQLTITLSIIYSILTSTSEIESRERVLINLMVFLYHQIVRTAGSFEYLNFLFVT